MMEIPCITVDQYPKLRVISSHGLKMHDRGWPEVPNNLIAV